MDTIYDLCKIREGVMKDEHQEDTLDLDNFRNGDIDGKRFFEENYLTGGMEQLKELIFKPAQKLKPILEKDMKCGLFSTFTYPFRLFFYLIKKDCSD